MTKIRKQKRAKKYRYNVNRKRMNKKKLPVLESATIQQAWNPHTSSQKNFRNFGLVFDVNKDIKYMNSKVDGNTECIGSKELNSSSVIQDLEKDAEVLSGKKNFRFSKDQTDYIVYLIEKYGDDYKAMSRDRKNYLQQTSKQIKHKISLFKSIPAHYNEYLKNKKKIQ